MGTWSKVKRFLVGEPLSNQMMVHERIPKWKALAVLASDALSSVSYATEEILIPLAAVSMAATLWSLPVALLITTLLIVIILSYRQTIDAYPRGSGAYFVVKENLGVYPSLVAAGALMIDYVLTVAVSTAAGVENIASAVPFFHAHKEAIGCLFIMILTLLNLRGVKDSATIFAIPTYFFIGSIVLVLGVGFVKLVLGYATPVAPVVSAAYPQIGLFLILRAFSSGCTALTGIEAISDAVSVFKEPTQKNAKITLAWMAVILVTFFLGITALTHAYGIMPHENETMVSQLARATLGGTSILYYVVQVAIVSILLLAANTAFADFPRVASFLGRDRYLPRQMASMGDRLVFSNGIIGLGLTASGLIILFKAETHLLIPLYALGVFICFTLSQLGMVKHHLRHRKPGWKGSMILNFFGMVTTALVLIVIAVTKFSHGAWIVILLIPCLVMLFTKIHTHYLAVGTELSLTGSDAPEKLEAVHHTVIIPVSGIHRGVIDALRYALSISKDVRACYVELDSQATERMKEEWMKWAHEVPFVVLKSPYRSVIGPLIQYIEDVEKTTHGDMITVIIPEFVTAKWWHQVLHNQTAFLIRAALLFKPRKVVTSVRYHLKSK